MKRIGEELTVYNGSERNVRKKICADLSRRQKINLLIAKYFNSSDVKELYNVYNRCEHIFDSSNLAYLLSSLERLSPDAEFINRLIVHIESIINTFDNGNIILVLNTLPNLYSLIGDRNEIYPMLAQNITYAPMGNAKAVNILHAFATVGWYDSEVLSKLLSKIDRVLLLHEYLPATRCRDVLISIAYFFVNIPHMVDSLLDIIVKDVQSLNAETIVMVLFSAAVLDFRKKDVFIELVSNIREPVTDASLNYMLLQVYVYALYGLESAALSKKLRCNFDYVLCSNQEPSPLVIDLMLHLRNLGIETTPNNSVSGIIVDLIVKGSNTVFEIGAKEKYFRQSTDLTGNVKFKIKLLTIMQYDVIVVPYYKYGLHMSTEEKMSYVKDLHIT
jgi:hypothetical protein